MEMPDNSSFPWLPDLGSRGGEPRHSSARHATRVGDLERDAAAQELGDHFAAGRLTIEELHERLSLVLSAQTRGQLVRVMADLPTPHQATSHVAPPPSATVLATSAGQEQDNGRDTAGRVGAVALLLLAILIWLFTALLFAGHGYGYHPGPHYPPPPWWHWHQ